MIPAMVSGILFLVNVSPYQRTDVFVVPSLVLDVWHACIKQVARSIPTSGRYPPQAAFDNTESFYSIPTQFFTEKFPLADSRTTRGGYTIPLIHKETPATPTHTISRTQRLVLAARTGVHTYSRFKARGVGHRLYLLL